MSIEFILRILVMLVFGFLGTRLGISASDFLEFEGGYAQFVTLVFMLMGALVGLVSAPWFTTRPAQSARLWIGKRSSLVLFTTIVGLLVGLLMAALLTIPLAQLPTPLNEILPVIMTLVLCYVSVIIFGNRAKDVARIMRLGALVEEKSDVIAGGEQSRRIFLDTSVIIDGRVADIGRLGFLGGTLLVPRFILAELQHIADSSDTLRRNRGRRGLEILNQMQQDESMARVEIIDEDVEGVRDADEKLVLLGRKYNAPVMTNDFNLNRVAELQGVTVLNINELANAVKAVYLPGESMNIRVIQEGKEINQGIGYLDDGTMVVIEEGVHYIDRSIEVEVTKHLQTQAGRMIFARPVALDRRNG